MRTNYFHLKIYLCTGIVPSSDLVQRPQLKSIVKWQSISPPPFRLLSAEYYSIRELF